MILHGTKVSGYGKYASITDDIKAKEKYNYNGISVSSMLNSTDKAESLSTPDNSYWKYINEVWEYTSSWDNTKGFDSIRYYHDKIVEYYNTTKDVRSKLNMPSYITVGLISKPGMGKSTLIRMLATTLGITDIYSVSDGPIDMTSASGIVIVEDYDRFVHKNEHIEAINALQYMENKINIIFYTSNSSLTDIISPDLVFDFGSHTYDTYARSVAIVGFCPDITDILFNAKISMREANMLLVNAIIVDEDKRGQYIKDSIGTIVLRDNMKYGREIECIDDWW